MTLFIHDTLTREKREFIPRDPKRVTVYVCGPTVYSYAHIGNARPVVVFDVLFRLLRHLYGPDQVVYARNITDVDDKINKAAIDQGVDISVVTEKFETIYNADMAALGALAPTHTPHATAHMPQMAALIEQLLERGMAYVVGDEVLFDVKAYEAAGGEYGALSGRSLDDMMAGARVEVADNKRHPADFVLWKPSKPGEPEWQGPEGLMGRPGWHIECSAMIEETLGLPIDIHGGGHDLIFPHHTNEIAQSCAAHGAETPSDYARYWMHNGFLDLSGEKMSKSLGNVVLVHDLIKHYPGEVIRLALLSAHYRSPLDWSPDLLEQSRKSLDKLYGALRRTADLTLQPDASAPASLLNALLNDLNTPLAISDLFEIAGSIERALNEGRADEAALGKSRLLDAGALLGLLQQDAEAWFKGGADDALSTKVEDLLEARKAARTAKNWPEADRIRDELNALNVEVMDSATGVSWKLKAPMGEG